MRRTRKTHFSKTQVISEKCEETRKKFSKTQVIFFEKRHNKRWKLKKSFHFVHSPRRNLDPGDYAISQIAGEKCKVMPDSPLLKIQPPSLRGRLCVKPVVLSGTSLWEATRTSPLTSVMDADCHSRLGATMMTALQPNAPAKEKRKRKQKSRQTKKPTGCPQFECSVKKQKSIYYVPVIYQKKFPRRDSNPGLSGESRIS